MVRSAAKYRVSNHGAAASFETHRFAMLLRMRRTIKKGPLAGPVCIRWRIHAAV